MNKVNLEELRAQVKAATDKADAQIKEQAEVALLQEQLSMATDPDVIAAKAALEVVNQNTAALERMVAQCDYIVTEHPIRNEKTRTNRAWKPSMRFGFGDQLNLIYQLANGITYACKEHRDLMLASTRLDAVLLNQILEGFGNPSYYDRKAHMVTEAEAYDLERITTAISVLQTTLGFKVDTSKLTKDNLSLEFGKAEAKANKDFKKAVEAMDKADLSM